MPVWIVSSAQNNPAVEQARAVIGARADVTTIFRAPEEAPDETFVRALCAIDEHHGPVSAGKPYDDLVVFGAKPGLATPEIMKELGFLRVANFDNGFNLSKGPAPQRKVVGE
jgi:hypothetical protein